MEVGRDAGGGTQLQHYYNPDKIERKLEPRLWKLLETGYKGTYNDIGRWKNGK